MQGRSSTRFCLRDIGIHCIQAVIALEIVQGSSQGGFLSLNPLAMCPLHQFPANALRHRLIAITAEPLEKIERVHCHKPLSIKVPEGALIIAHIIRDRMRSITVLVNVSHVFQPPRHRQHERKKKVLSSILRMHGPGAYHSYQVQI